MSQRPSGVPVSERGPLLAWGCWIWDPTQHAHLGFGGDGSEAQLAATWLVTHPLPSAHQVEGPSVEPW
jgi:hypothetical protein